MAVRVQRKRSRGWKMPENTVYVGRPSLFGNPFDVRRWGREVAIRLFRNTATGFWSPDEVPAGQSVEIAYQEHMEFLDQLTRAGYKQVDALYAIRSQLRGKNLACWCPLDQPCHADVLLELANGSVVRDSGIDPDLRER